MENTKQIESLLLAINEKLDLILARKRKSTPHRPQAPRQEVFVSDLDQLFLISHEHGAWVSRNEVYLHIKDWHPHITRPEAFRALRQWHKEKNGDRVKESKRQRNGDLERGFNGILFIGI